MTVRRGAWSSQYVILSALSIYMVMQTMEAVIFRSLLLSIPCWLSWRWAMQAPVAKQDRYARRYLRTDLREQELTYETSALRTRGGHA